MSNIEEQFKDFMQRVLGYMQHASFYNIPVKPYAAIIQGGATGTIPDKVKSFNIINLGLSGAGLLFEDIPVSGISNLTAIPKQLTVFGYTIENDQNLIVGPIIVTPPLTSKVLIQYLL